MKQILLPPHPTLSPKGGEDKRRDGHYHLLTLPSPPRAERIKGGEYKRRVGQKSLPPHPTLSPKGERIKGEGKGEIYENKENYTI